jgi:hypothetical protein
MPALAVQGRTNAAGAGMRRSGATCIRTADAAQDVPISRKHRDVRERSPHTEVRAGADSRFASDPKDGW